MDGEAMDVIQLIWPKYRVTYINSISPRLILTVRPAKETLFRTQLLEKLNLLEYAVKEHVKNVIQIILLTREIVK